ncbi:50S ribosomal protein L11 methyltransferase [Candidatus Omnitrophota bacterium]
MPWNPDMRPLSDYPEDAAELSEQQVDEVAKAVARALIREKDEYETVAQVLKVKHFAIPILFNVGRHIRDTVRTVLWKRGIRKFELYGETRLNKKFLGLMVTRGDSELELESDEPASPHREPVLVGAAESNDAMGKFKEIKPVKLDKQGRLTGRIKHIDAGDEDDAIRLSDMKQTPVKRSDVVKDYITPVKQLIQSVTSPEERELLDKILKKFRANLPNRVIITEGGIEGFFGIGRSDFLAIDKGLLEDPESFLHEVIEYVKQKDIAPEIIREMKSLLKKDKSPKYAKDDRYLGYAGGTWLENHKQKYKKQGKLAYFTKNRPHYIIRAFTRQVFRKRDKELTGKIKKEQKRGDKVDLAAAEMNKVSNMTTWQGRLFHSNSMIKHLVDEAKKETGRELQVVDIGPGYPPVTAQELSDSGVSVVAVDNFIPVAEVRNPKKIRIQKGKYKGYYISEESSILFDDKGNIVVRAKRTAGLNITGKDISETARKKLVGLYKKLSAEATQRPDGFFEDDNGNTIQLNPLNKYPVQVVRGDILDLDSSLEAQKHIKNADIIRISNVVIPHYEDRESMQKIFSGLAKHMKIGAKVIMTYVGVYQFNKAEEGVEYVKEEGGLRPVNLLLGLKSDSSIEYGTSDLHPLSFREMGDREEGFARIFPQALKTPPKYKAFLKRALKPFKTPKEGKAVSLQTHKRLARGMREMGYGSNALGEMVSISLASLNLNEEKKEFEWPEEFAEFFDPKSVLGATSTVRSDDGTAKRWSEEKQKAIANKLAKTLGLYPLIKGEGRKIMREDKPYDGFDVTMQEWIGESPQLYLKSKKKPFIRLNRVGHLFFIDRTTHEKLRKINRGLFDDVKNNLIVLDEIRADSTASNHTIWTALTAIEMMHRDIEGLRGIDLGAGYGTLAVTALKLGASFVDLIEMDPKACKKAREHLRLNGFKEGKDYQIHRQNLGKTKDVVKALSQRDEKSFVVCNIGVPRDIVKGENLDILKAPPVPLEVGTWERGFYSVNNTDIAERLIPALRKKLRISLLIFGGYREDLIASNGKDEGNINSFRFSQKDWAIISEQGFSNVRTTSIGESLRIFKTAWSADTQMQDLMGRIARNPDEINRVWEELEPFFDKRYEFEQVNNTILRPFVEALKSNGKTLNWFLEWIDVRMKSLKKEIKQVQTENKNEERFRHDSRPLWAQDGPSIDRSFYHNRGSKRNEKIEKLKEFYAVLKEFRRYIGASEQSPAALAQGGGAVHTESMKLRGDRYDSKSWKDGKKVKISNVSQAKAFGDALVKKSSYQVSVPGRDKDITVIVEEDVNLSGEEVGALIEHALSRLKGDVSKMPSTLVISLLDKSSHMFEDHQRNGFIGINKYINEIGKPKIRKILLQVGLVHELSHEITGQGDELEEAQLKRDAEYMAQLMQDENVKMDVLKEALKPFLEGTEFVDAVQAVTSPAAWTKVPLLTDLGEIKKLYEQYYSGQYKYKINAFRLMASIANLSQDKDKLNSFRSFAEGLHEKTKGFGFGAEWRVKTDIERGEVYLNEHYDPVMEILERILKFKPKKRMYAKPGWRTPVLGGELDNLQKLILGASRAREEEIIAHGTGNYDKHNKWGHMEEPRPLERIDALLAIMVSGKIKGDTPGNRPDVGYLSGDEDPSRDANLYGPYYVVLTSPPLGRIIDHRDGLLPDYYYAENGSMPSKYHALYLVPDAEDVKFLTEGLKEAVRLGFMSEENKKKAISRIITYKAFVDKGCSVPVVPIINMPRDISKGGEIDINARPFADLDQEAGEKLMISRTKTLGKTLEVTMNHNLPKSYGVVMGGVPTDPETGKPSEKIMFDSPLDKIKGEGNRFIAKKQFGRNGNVHLLHSMGVFEALEILVEKLPIGKVARTKIDCTITTSVLKELETLLGMVEAEEDLQLEESAKDAKERLNELLRMLRVENLQPKDLGTYLNNNTMLTIIDDIKIIEGMEVIFPMRYGMGIELSLTGLNLGHIIEAITKAKKSGENIQDDTVYRDAVKLRAKAVGVFTNFSDNIDEIFDAMWAKAKESPELFIRLVTKLTLPDVKPMDVNRIRERFVQEAEALRAV